MAQAVHQIAQPVPQMSQPVPQLVQEPAPAEACDTGYGPPVIIPAGPRTWEGFLAFAAEKSGSGTVTGLTRAQGELCGAELVIQCFNETHSSMMSRGDTYLCLKRLVQEYFGPDVTVSFTCQDREPVKTHTQLERESQTNPVVQRICQTFEVKEPVTVHPRGQN